MLSTNYLTLNLLIFNELFFCHVLSRLLIKDDLNAIGLQYQTMNSENTIDIIRPDNSPVFITIPLSLTYTFKDEKLGGFSANVLYTFEKDSRLQDFVFKNDFDNQSFTISEHFLSIQALNVSISWFPPKKWF
jgi:hypothetical protein